MSAAALAAGPLPGAATAHAPPDVAATTEVPMLIREALYAPPCPADVAAMLEVARVHHDDGELERAVEMYGRALARWEEHGAQAKLGEAGVTAEQVELQRAEFHASATESIAQVTSQVHSVHSVMSVEDKEAEIAKEVASWQVREQQLLQAIAERQAEALSVGVLALVPVEGRVYYHLAVGAVFDTAGRDENAMREYLEALRLLREGVPGFHMQLMAATVYGCLAVAYFHLSQYDFAADYLFRALEIREDALPAGHVDTAATLCNIGATLIALNRVADSLVLLARARAILEHQLPAHHSRLWILSMNEALARRRGLGPDAAFHAVPFVVCKPPMIKGARSIVVAAGTAQMEKAAAAAAKLKESQKGRR